MRAAEISNEHGINAAAWWEQDTLGGRATGEYARYTAETVLKGIEDGDPEIVDSLPYPDLSGQWADSYSSHDLLEELGVNDGDASFHDGLTDEVFDLRNGIHPSRKDAVAGTREAILMGGDDV